MKFLSKLFSSKPAPPMKFIQALQVEVSSLCNLNCVFCPTTYLKFDEEPKLLPLDYFQKLTSFFPYCHWVYLQGWGEPLLHKDFWTMARIAKETGVKVGFTTNGTLFNQKNLDNLFRESKPTIDLISFSIAGATETTHNKIRQGSELNKIIEAIQKVDKLKKQHKSKFPIIKLSYMLTKESIHELTKAVELAHSLKVNDFYTTNLDYVFSQNMDAHKVFTFMEKAKDEYQEIIKKAKRIAHEKQLIFRTYPLALREEQYNCDLSPDSYIFITANGDVTPCTYLGRKNNPRYFQQELIEIPKKVFGNLGKDSLETIWNTQEYADFRKNFIVRKEAFIELTNKWQGCKSLIKVNRAEEEYLFKLMDNPPPIECQTCYKIYGA